MADRHAVRLVVDEDAGGRRRREAERAVRERVNGLQIEVDAAIGVAGGVFELTVGILYVDFEEVEVAVRQDEMTVALILDGAKALLVHDAAVRVDNLLLLRRREADHELVFAPRGLEERARPRRVLTDQSSLVAETEVGIRADADRGVSHEDRLDAFVREAGVAEEEGGRGRVVGDRGLEEVAFEQPEREREIHPVGEGLILEAGKGVAGSEDDLAVVVLGDGPSDRGRDPRRPCAGAEEGDVRIAELEVEQRLGGLLLEGVRRRLRAEFGEREGTEDEEGYACSHVRYSMVPHPLCKRALQPRLRENER